MPLLVCFQASSSINCRVESPKARVESLPGRTAALQAHYALIQRVAASPTDAANGTATQPGGPFRYLLQANYTGNASPHVPSKPASE